MHLVVQMVDDVDGGMDCAPVGLPIMERSVNWWTPPCPNTSVQGMRTAPMEHVTTQLGSAAVRIPIAMAHYANTNMIVPLNYLLL